MRSLNFRLYHIQEQTLKFCKLSFHFEIKPQNFLSNKITKRLSTAKSCVIYLAHHEGMVLILYSSGDDLAVSFPDHHLHKEFTMAIALCTAVPNKAF